MIKMTFAAPKSGSGKTFITCAVINLLKRHGYNVCSFKCGPDYIDPMFHRNALGIPSYNMDLFFLSEEQAKEHFAAHSEGFDAVVCEGVMGYYDGLGGTTTVASTYHMASTIGSPVILVVQPKGTSLTLAAQIKGLMDFREDSNIKGVILNQCSKMLYSSLRKVIESECGVEVIGYVPDMEAANIKSRHLGLYTAGEVSDITERLDILADQLEESLDYEKLIELCTFPDIICEHERSLAEEPQTVEIGVAMDDAFCFIYQENIDLLEKNGAKIRYFSPIRDEALPEGISGLYIPGGYPEIYAKALSDNTSMRKAILDAVTSRNMPVVAECGGFQYLGRTLEGEDGNIYEMTGVIESDAVRKERLVRFGYINLEAKEDSLLLEQDDCIKAHEFHYWDSSDNGSSMHAEKPVSGRNWDCCYANDHMYAGYPHIYFPNNEKMAKRFVEKAREYSSER